MMHACKLKLSEATSLRFAPPRLLPARALAARPAGGFGRLRGGAGSYAADTAFLRHSLIHHSPTLQQVSHQVLQLLDERSALERDFVDPDNRLLEDDYSTLRELLFSQGCALSLHSLAPGECPAADDEPGEPCLGAAVPPRLSAQATLHTLATAVAPSRADHSFAGVIFDVHARSEQELVVTGVHVGGMLGRVRVFARTCSWKGDDVAARTVNTGWGTRYDFDHRHWEQVAEEECAPSWDTAREVRLAHPVHVLPHHTRALFVHSSLPDDLGIQYQSYHSVEPFAQDPLMTLLPGLGFTGAVPFDTRTGWFRLHRGLAGCVSYAAQPARWSCERHRLFPGALKRCVLWMLMAQRRPESPLALLPTHLVLRILQLTHWDWAVPAGVTPPLGGTREGGGVVGGDGEDAPDARTGDAAAAYGSGDDEEDEEEEEWFESDDDDGDAFE